MLGLSRLFPKSKIFARYNLTYLNPDKTAEVEAISGSFFMVRKSALKKVGLLDEDFFMFGEDLDWSYRFLKAGYKIYYYPEAQIIHFKGKSSEQDNERYIRLFHEAMIIFYRKHYRSNFFVNIIISFLIHIRMYLLLFINKFRAVLCISKTEKHKNIV
jgi:hypothetical protein